MCTIQPQLSNEKGRARGIGLKIKELKVYKILNSMEAGGI
jgi:hypothetical protein